MLGETFKRVDSELGQKAVRYSSSSLASEQELGDALKQLQALLRDQVSRTNPDASALFKAADTAWANLVRLEGAAKKTADGVFTPGQLSTAVREADKSVRKRAVARGTALMQDLASAGQNVLGNKVPNSGTPERMMMGVGALGAGYIHPGIPIGLGLGAAAYTPPAQSLLRGAVTMRPSGADSVAQLLNQASPMLSPASGLLALDLVE
jgi:hypothetical protein